MSEENVEIVRGFFEAFGQGDWDVVYQAADPDFELVLHANAFPDPGTYRGEEAARRAWGRFLEVWEDFGPEEERFIDAGEHVVVLFRIRGRGKGSGIEVTLDASNVYTFRGGRVIRVALYGSWDEGLEAAGLRE
jgi:uncharacterized protein